VVQDSRGQTWRGIVIKDSIADIALQQVLTVRRIRRDRHAQSQRRLLSDALARRLAASHRPGGNINYITGHAIFEATHAPRRNTPAKTWSTPAP